MLGEAAQNRQPQIDLLTGYDWPSIDSGGRNFFRDSNGNDKPIDIGSAYWIWRFALIPDRVPSRCIVGIGSVITSELTAESHLIVGVPAKAVKELSEEDQFLIQRKTRLDLPDDV